MTEKGKYRFSQFIVPNVRNSVRKISEVMFAESILAFIY